jgi:hypothetical protein
MSTSAPASCDCKLCTRGTVFTKTKKKGTVARFIILYRIFDQYSFDSFCTSCVKEVECFYIFFFQN